MYKIEFDVNSCTGCGMCKNFCPENWSLVGAKARPRARELYKIGANKDAEDNCPANAIKIVNVK